MVLDDPTDIVTVAVGDSHNSHQITAIPLFTNIVGMEISGQWNSPISTSRICDSREIHSSVTPHPPPPLVPLPPQIPPSPCQPPPPLSSSTLVLTESPESSIPSQDGRQLVTNAKKNEICTGIQKLLSWGMCNQEDDTVWVASNRQTSPILQQGPECGVAALCMAANMLEPYTSVPANKSQILQTAKDKRYTIQGEMFSAKNLLELATGVGSIHGEVLEGNMVDNRDDIISHLANGWPVLVPYDKDGNCEPCCRRGHKAHWAVITGFVLHGNRHSLPDLNSSQWIQQDPTMPNLYHLSVCTPDQHPKSPSHAIREILQSVPASSTYVLARQGKSRHIHPWSYTTLSDSNSDLLEVGSNIENNMSMFVIPEGGIQDGLCSRVVLIRP